MKKFLSNKWIKLLGKILLTMLIIILILILIIFLVLKFWPPLGGTISKEDMENYAKRASNYKDGLFSNEEAFELKYKRTENIYLSTKNTKPKKNVKNRNTNLIRNIN